MDFERSSYTRRQALNVLASTSAAIAATSLIPRSAFANPLPELSIVSFPGPSISAHSKVVIKGLGLDRANGWNLKWVTTPTTDAYYNDMVTGVYDSIDLGGLNVFANLYNRGVPLKVVQATVHWPSPLVIRKDSGIRELGDLSGKRLGVSRASFVYAYVVASASAAGLDLENDIHVESVDFFQALPRLQRGDFDAATLLFEHAIDLVATAPDDFAILTDVSATYAEAIGIERTYQYQAIRQDWLEANKDLVGRITRTYDELGSVFAERPQDAVELLVQPREQGGASLQPHVAEIEYVQGTQEGYKTEWLSRPVGGIRDDLMRELEAFLDNGLIEQMPDDGLFYVES